jgi:hypothetical protein
MSTVSFKSDDCYLNQKAEGNKTIFDYMTDTNAFVNKNKCADYSPPFLSYIPMGTPKQNVDIENQLRGTTKATLNSKCSITKYQSPEQGNLANIGNNFEINKIFPNVEKECKEPFKIIDGYIKYNNNGPLY